jgi:uncharacterized protein
MIVVNHTKKFVLVERCVWADKPWARMQGWLGRTSVKPGDGIVLWHTKGIHTFGMKFPIDVLFLNQMGQVIRLIHGLPPSRISPIVWTSAGVVEMCAGVLRQSGTTAGDLIVLCQDTCPVPPDFMRLSDLPSETD